MKNCKILKFLLAKKSIMLFFSYVLLVKRKAFVCSLETRILFFILMMHKNMKWGFLAQFISMNQSRTEVFIINFIRNAAYLYDDKYCMVAVIPTLLPN